jgi:hypothetical protein
MNARYFEDVETSVLKLRRTVLNTLFLWVSAHHSPSSVTFVEFLISCSFVSYWYFCILLVY